MDDLGVMHLNVFRKHRLPADKMALDFTDCENRYIRWIRFMNI